MVRVIVLYGVRSVWKARCSILGRWSIAVHSTMTLPVGRWVHKCGINFSHLQVRIEASQPPMQCFLMNFDSILLYNDCDCHVTRAAGFPDHLRRGFPLWTTLAFAYSHALLGNYQENLGEKVAKVHQLFKVSLRYYMGKLTCVHHQFPKHFRY